MTNRQFGSAVWSRMCRRRGVSVVILVLGCASQGIVGKAAAADRGH